MGMAFAATPATAVTIGKVDITHKKRTYDVTFDVLVAADPVKARRLLTDYSQWPHLSDTITESRLLETLPDGRQRVSVSFRSCVLTIFCKTIRQVKDMETGPSRSTYRTEMVSGHGDFASGWELWQIVAEGNKTRLHYDAKLVLAFHVPPLIGPWILKRKLRRELIVTATKVEKLAAR